jgi:DNA-binding CsgD family transcriptional regulator
MSRARAKTNFGVEVSSGATIVLSSREKRLLRRFAQGKADKKIAAEIGGTEQQVSAQRQRVLRKLQIRTEAQLISLAAQLASWPARPRATGSANERQAGIFART